jgi:universal stress protein A
MQLADIFSSPDTEPVMPVIHTILHPTDLSENSKNAFHLACALARDYGAELVVLNVFPPPLSGAEAVDRRRPDGIEEALMEKLRDWTAEEQSIQVEHRVEEGDAAKLILDTARTCDLVVMGTHGRTGLRRALLGSVAEKVLREARCPVVTVRSNVSVPEDRAKDAVPVAEGPGKEVELGTGD